MRPYVAIPLFALASAIASAERIALTMLPVAAFADTEVSTNIAMPCLTNRIDVAPANTDSRKTLTLKLGIRPDGALRDISLLDGETPIPAKPVAMPSALSWNLLRLTVRGVEPTLENLAVRNAPDGTQIIFR